MLRYVALTCCDRLVGALETTGKARIMRGNSGQPEKETPLCDVD